MVFVKRSHLVWIYGLARFVRRRACEGPRPRRVVRKGDCRISGEKYLTVLEKRVIKTELRASQDGCSAKAGIIEKDGAVKVRETEQVRGVPAVQPTDVNRHDMKARGDSRFPIPGASFAPFHDRAIVTVGRIGAIQINLEASTGSMRTHVVHN